jgi:thymidylate kinase
LSWNYQRKGVIVVFDRYFLFDFQRSDGHGHGTQSFFERLHYRHLESFYPRPDLVIFLDAPAEVLYARKQEGTLEHLNERRRTFLNIGKQLKHFIVIDSSQPLEKVYEQDWQEMRSFQATRTTRNDHANRGLPAAMQGQDRVVAMPAATAPAQSHAEKLVS